MTALHRYGARRIAALVLVLASLCVVAIGVFAEISVGDASSATTARVDGKGGTTTMASSTNPSTSVTSLATTTSSTSAPSTSTSTTSTSTTSTTQPPPTTAAPPTTTPEPAAAQAPTPDDATSAPPTATAPQARVRGSVCSDSELGQGAPSTDGGTVTCVVNPNGINPHWR